MTGTQTLVGQVALVTGASRGIGKDVALALARAGADVACSATRAENCAAVVAEIQALGRKAVALGGNVAVTADVEALFEKTEAALGPVELLVANAGISRPRPLLEMSDADFDDIVAVNQRSVFLCARAFGQRRQAAGGGGALVVIGSIAGINAFPNRLNYCAAKAAAHHMVKVIACEWAGMNTRVNAIAPGYIETDMVAQRIASGDVDVAALQRRIPQGGMGQGEDIGAAAVYFCSTASRYVTGTILPVDGGWTAYGFL